MQCEGSLSDARLAGPPARIDSSNAVLSSRQIEDYRQQSPPSTMTTAGSSSAAPPWPTPTSQPPMNSQTAHPQPAKSEKTETELQLPTRRVRFPLTPPPSGSDTEGARSGTTNRILRAVRAARQTYSPSPWKQSSSPSKLTRTVSRSVPPLPQTRASTRAARTDETVHHDERYGRHRDYLGRFLSGEDALLCRPDLDFSRDGMSSPPLSPTENPATQSTASTVRWRCGGLPAYGSKSNVHAFREAAAYTEPRSPQGLRRSIRKRKELWGNLSDRNVLENPLVWESEGCSGTSSGSPRTASRREEKESGKNKRRRIQQHVDDSIEGDLDLVVSDLPEDVIETHWQTRNSVGGKILVEGDGEGRDRRDDQEEMYTPPPEDTVDVRPRKEDGEIEESVAEFVSRSISESHSNYTPPPDDTDLELETPECENRPGTIPSEALTKGKKKAVDFDMSPSQESEYTLPPDDSNYDVPEGPSTLTEEPRSTSDLPKHMRWKNALSKEVDSPKKVGRASGSTSRKPPRRGTKRSTVFESVYREKIEALEENLRAREREAAAAEYRRRNSSVTDRSDASVMSDVSCETNTGRDFSPALTLGSTPSCMEYDHHDQGDPVVVSGVEDDMLVDVNIILNRPKGDEARGKGETPLWAAREEEVDKRVNREEVRAAPTLDMSPVTASSAAPAAPAENGRVSRGESRGTSALTVSSIDEKVPAGGVNHSQPLKPITTSAVLSTSEPITVAPLSSTPKATFYDRLLAAYSSERDKLQSYAERFTRIPAAFAVARARVLKIETDITKLQCEDTKEEFSCLEKGLYGEKDEELRMEFFGAVADGRCGVGWRKLMLQKS